MTATPCASRWSCGTTFTGVECSAGTRTPVELPTTAPPITSVMKCLPAMTRATPTDEAMVRPTASVQAGYVVFGSSLRIAIHDDVAIANETEVWLLRNERPASLLLRTLNGAF